MSRTNKAALNDGKVRPPVEEVDRLRFANALRKEFNSLKGRIQGVSLPQLGYDYAGILCRFRKGMEPVIMFNPKVLFKFGLGVSNEGCMEVQGRYYVLRPWVIKLEYLTENFEPRVEWFTWKKARIICHEVDHLHGICIDKKGFMKAS